MAIVELLAFRTASRRRAPPAPYAILPAVPSAGGAWTFVEIIVIANPRGLAATPLWGEARARLSGLGALRVEETRGDGTDAARLAALLATQAADVVVAAGGDGTVREVAAALMQLAPPQRPQLAILPLGTANNVARSLGFLALRQRGQAAIERTVAAIGNGGSQPLDLGRVNGAWFIGSFAIGMDAAILATRNRWRAGWHLGPRLGGYPLYLASCAANLARPRAVTARLSDAGAVRQLPLYNLLVANTALYAGEFRFDAHDHSGDGLLDLHVFPSSTAYVRGFVGAWRRHVHFERGAAVEPPPLERLAHILIELDAPLPSQLDGEQGAVAARFEVTVEAAALRVCVATAGG
ncbi:MAG: diacylglycerol kinase family protein [Casimicrobiaceae bacterium]